MLPPAANVEEEACARAGAGLPFGYRVQRAGGLLMLRRPDGSVVAAFDTGTADPFEVEALVWEDAD